MNLILFKRILRELLPSAFVLFAINGATDKSLNEWPLYKLFAKSHMQPMQMYLEKINTFFEIANSVCVLYIYEITKEEFVCWKLQLHKYSKTSVVFILMLLSKFLNSGHLKDFKYLIFWYDRWVKMGHLHMSIDNYNLTENKTLKT